MTLDEYAAYIAGLSRGELMRYNDCLGSQGLRLEDNRQNVPSDGPNNAWGVLQDRPFQVLAQLMTDVLWWQADDIKRFDTLLAPCNIRLKREKVVKTWEAV